MFARGCLLPRVAQYHNPNPNYSGRLSEKRPFIGIAGQPLRHLLQREVDSGAEAPAATPGRDGQELVPAGRVRRPRRRHVRLHRMSDPDLRRPHPA